MANTLTGTPAAAAIYVQVREHAAALDAPPCLAAVSVGAQPDDLAYLRSIAQAAEDCGTPCRLPKICAIFKQIFTNSCSFPQRETL